MCRSSRAAPPPPPAPVAVPTQAFSDKIPELNLAIESDSDADTKKKKAKKAGKKSLRTDLYTDDSSPNLNIPN
jgi:hypothetical protein|tara:strand:- start:163 stop:381 length:219 start_codon:yes stop_codon:yes gene_type:complete